MLTTTDAQMKSRLRDIERGDTKWSVLKEKPHKFSRERGAYLLFAGLLGILNLFGAVALKALMKEYAFFASANLVGPVVPTSVRIARVVHPLLLFNAVFFNVVPLVRIVCIGSLNARIARRNESRREWLRLLSTRTGSVRRKLGAAVAFGVGRKHIRDDDIIFSSGTTTTKPKQRAPQQLPMLCVETELQMERRKNVAQQGLPCIEQKAGLGDMDLLESMIAHQKDA